MSTDSTRGWSAWCRAHAGDLAAALSGGGTAGLRVEVAGVAAKDGSQLRADLCKDGVAFALSDDAGAPLLVLVACGASASALAAAAAGGDVGDLGRRYADDAPTADGEIEALRGFGKTVGAVLATAAGGGTAFGSPVTLRLAEGRWEEDRDPIPEGAALEAELRLVAEGLEPVPLLLVAGVAAAKRCAPGLLSSEPRPAASERSAGLPRRMAALVADAGLRERLGRLLGDPEALDRTVGMAEFVRGFSDPEVEAGFVEIPAGREYLLPTLRGLKDWPGCESKPLIIQLDAPDPESVLFCGRLGLFGILPPGFEDDDFVRRLDEERALAREIAAQTS